MTPPSGKRSQAKKGVKLHVLCSKRVAIKFWHVFENFDEILKQKSIDIKDISLQPTSSEAAANFMVKAEIWHQNLWFGIRQFGEEFSAHFDTLTKYDIRNE